LPSGPAICYHKGARLERAFPDLLHRHGEADLFRTDLEEHDRRREAGQLFFFGPVEEEGDPDWLDRLLRAVARRLVAHRPVDSLAYRYCPSPFIPELHVCPPARQGWAVDIEGLREAFDKVECCGWYAAPAKQGEIPYFWVGRQ
jgi:hypothetical protein